MTDQIPLSPAAQAERMKRLYSKFVGTDKEAGYFQTVYAPLPAKDGRSAGDYYEMYPKKFHFGKLWSSWQPEDLKRVPDVTMAVMFNIAADDKDGTYLRRIMPTAFGDIETFRKAIFSEANRRYKNNEHVPEYVSEADAIRLTNEANQEIAARQQRQHFERYAGSVTTKGEFPALYSASVDYKAVAPNQMQLVKSWQQWQPADLIRIPDSTMKELSLLATQDTQGTYLGRITPPAFGSVEGFRQAILNEAKRRKDAGIKVPDYLDPQTAESYTKIVKALVDMRAASTSTSARGGGMSDNSDTRQPLDPQTMLASLDQATAGLKTPVALTNAKPTGADMQASLDLLRKATALAA